MEPVPIENPNRQGGNKVHIEFPKPTTFLLSGDSAIHSDRCVTHQSCSALIWCLFSVQPKYFDSGDYNMAKAKMKNKQLPSAPTEKTEITGGHIPTPQDLPQRKTSIVTSKLAGWHVLHLPVYHSNPPFHSYLAVYVLFNVHLFVCIRSRTSCVPSQTVKESWQLSCNELSQREMQHK